VSQLVSPWAEVADADAELVVAVPADEAVTIGAFARTVDASARGLPILRRASGGAAAYVGPGTVWTQLALARPDALAAGEADKILNRYVRPILRAITAQTGKPARYYGRDWVALEGRPVAMVAFGHDAGTGRAVFEAVVAVNASFATSDARASFAGKPPGTLSGIAGRRIETDAVAQAVLDAYRALATASEERDVERARASAVSGDLPWLATREEAIGIVAAGRDVTGRLRVGGELMASRDAVARLEDALASPDRDRIDLEAAIDASLTAPGVVTFGVRSLASIRDVVAEALRTSPGAPPST
jgi:hypothetical protein